MSGDETAAVAILSALDDAHARNLLALIRRPRLRVLTMLPSPAHGPHVLLPGSVNDAKFELTNIGYGRDDEPCRPDADIFDYADPTRPPDFLVCVMVEWHAIPPNLTDLPCPLLGHTADFDLHLHPVLPWLRLDATTPRAHTAMAQDRFDEGRPEEALAILRQCLALTPADEASRLPNCWIGFRAQRIRRGGADRPSEIPDAAVGIAKKSWRFLAFAG